MQKLNKFWNDLGEIALSAILKSGKKLLFSNADFADRRDVLESGLIIGLLIRHESAPSDDPLKVQELYYSFPHLLFQEKCAGDYLKTCDLATLHTHLQNIKTKNEALNLQYMLLFTSGEETSEQTTESIINYLVTLHDAPGSHLRESYRVSEPQNGDIKRISTKLSEGMSYMTRSLWELGLFINYECQKEGKMSMSLTKLLPDDYCMVLSGQNLIYPAQCYFLEHTKSSITTILKTSFTSSDVSFDHALHMSSPSRNLAILGSSIPVINPEQYLNPAQESSMSNLTRITLRRISTNIPLCDVLTLTTALCPVLKYFEVNRCRIDLKQYTELQTMLGKPHPSLTYFKVDKCREVISMIDLLGITSIMCPELDMLELSRCRVEIPDHTQLQKTDCEKKNSQLTIDISCYSDVSLVGLIAAASVFYQSLQAIRIHTIEQWTDNYSCGIKLSHPSHLLPSDTMIELEDMDLSWYKEHSALISVSTVLALTSVMCPQLKHLKVRDCDLDIPHARKDNEGKMMCLKTLDLCGNVKLSVQINDFIHMASSLFPKLEKMLIGTGDNKKTQIRSSLRHPTQTKMKLLEEVQLDCHQQNLSVIDIIRVIAELCPVLKTLKLSGIVDTSPDEWKANALVSNKMLALEELILSGLSISLFALLKYTAKVCPRVETLKVSACYIDPEKHQSSSAPNDKLSSLENIDLSFLKPPKVPLFYVLSSISNACPNLRKARIGGSCLINESSDSLSHHKHDKLMSLQTISLCAYTHANMFGLLPVVKVKCPNVKKIDLSSPGIMYSDEDECGETIHLKSSDLERNTFLRLAMTANLCPNLKQMCIERYEIALGDEVENVTPCQLLSLECLELKGCTIASLAHFFEAINSICPNLGTLRMSGCKFPVSEQSSRVTCVQPTHIEVLELDYWDGMNGEMRCESFESIKQIISTWCPNAKDPVLTFFEDDSNWYSEESSDSEREDFW